MRLMKSFLKNALSSLQRKSTKLLNITHVKLDSISVAFRHCDVIAHSSCKRVFVDLFIEIAFLTIIVNRNG